MGEVHLKNDKMFCISTLKSFAHVSLIIVSAVMRCSVTFCLVKILLNVLTRNQYRVFHLLALPVSSLRADEAHASMSNIPLIFPYRPPTHKGSLRDTPNGLLNEVALEVFRRKINGKEYTFVSHPKEKDT